MHTFSGHIGAVRSLAWSRDDAFLYSAAHDGAVYRWSLTTGTRSDEVPHVVKQCQYTAVVVDEKDPRVVVAAGSDGKVRELVAGEETAVVHLAPGVCVTAMALAKDNTRLFAGTNIGSVLAYPWPLSSSKGVVESFAHAEAVSHMSITEDNEHLVTSSDDGSICVFRIGALSSVVAVSGESSGVIDTALVLADTSTSDADALKQPEKKRAAVAFTDAVLIARDDLEERHAALTELHQRFEQVKADVEFALHRKENEWIDRLRIVKNECEALVVQERVRYEELETRHQQASRKHTEELAQKAAGHATLTQELENQYEHKLAQEVARYDALSETLELTRQRCEALLESQDSQHRGTLHGERKAAYARAKEQNEVIRRLHDDLTHNHVKFEEVLHQEETEYEHELASVRAAFETQLERERQNTAVKEGHVSATNKKLESLQKKLQELKASSLARDVLFATERAKTTKLEATLAHYEQHFETCAFSLADKDKAIHGLTSSNRVLENFRSVLHHRIDHLEVAKAPIEAHMHGLEAHIAEMQTELFDEFRAKAAVGKDVASKDAKIKMLHHEVKRLRQSTLQKEYAVSEMTRELTRLAQLTNLKDMEAAVKDAYRTFVIGELVHKKPPRATTVLRTNDSGSSDHNDNSSNTQTTNKLTVTAQSLSDWGGSPLKRGGGASPLPRATTAPSPMKVATTSKPAHGFEQRRGSGLVSSTPTNRSSSHATDDALGYDCKQAVDESVKQLEYMSRTVQTLRTALENTKIKADRVRRDSVAEGSVLIDECNKLRKENKRLHFKMRELEHALGASTGGLRSPPVSGSTAAARASTPTGTNNELSTSFSCPELLVPLQLSPECDAAQDASNARGKLLLPLSITPFSKPPRARAGSSSSLRSPLSTRNGSTTSGLRSRPSHNNNVLPFARLELEREKRSGCVMKNDSMAQLVERQHKEIERLQSRVQLLLADAEDSSGSFTIIDAMFVPRLASYD